MAELAPVVTIDGPSGSGKGTLARMLAKGFGWHWLDSGAIYRLLALDVLQSGIEVDDFDAIEQAALRLDVSFQNTGDEEPAIYLGGKLVASELRTEQCGNAASKLAAIPIVRAALLKRQQDFHQDPGLVADGRDMGTVVFPDADLKLFLTASLEERVNRRYKQLKEKGFDISIDALFQEISARDERDANREIAPLQPADDAVVVDCSSMNVQEMIDCAKKLLEERGLVG